MRRYRFVFGLAFVLCSTRTPAQTMPAPPSHLPVTIEVQGFPLKSILKPPNALGVGMIDNRFPTENLLRVSQIPSSGFGRNFAQRRGRRDLSDHFSVGGPDCHEGRTRLGLLWLARPVIS